MHDKIHAKIFPYRIRNWKRNIESCVSWAPFGILTYRTPLNILSGFFLQPLPIVLSSSSAKILSLPKWADNPPSCISLISWICKEVFGTYNWFPLKRYPSCMWNSSVFSKFLHLAIFDHSCISLISWIHKEIFDTHNWFPLKRYPFWMWNSPAFSNFLHLAHIWPNSSSSAQDYGNWSKLINSVLRISSRLCLQLRASVALFSWPDLCLNT